MGAVRTMKPALTAVEHCFVEAKLRDWEMYSRPEQEGLREQLPHLLSAIFTNDDFSKLRASERVAFHNDYTDGVAKLLLTGDCRPLFDAMEEWYEVLEELADYEEFEAELKREHNIDLRYLE
jgi:hypothetical protein